MTTSCGDGRRRTSESAELPLCETEYLCPIALASSSSSISLVLKSIVLFVRVRGTYGTVLYKYYLRHVVVARVLEERLGFASHSTTRRQRGTYTRRRCCCVEDDIVTQVRDTDRVGDNPVVPKEGEHTHPVQAPA